MLRRKEAIETIQNLNDALGFNTEGAYLEGRAINPKVKPIKGEMKDAEKGAKHKVRLWGYWYLLGILICPIGVFLVIFKP